MRPFSALTVLIVDDDPNSRAILSRLLSKRFGCRVLEAGNGAEGLKALDEERPDLLLLDLMMPGMSGKDVLAALRRRPELANVPVIICSAVDSLERVKAVIGLGVEDYVLKPFAFETLIPRLEALLTKVALRPTGLVVTDDTAIFQLIQAVGGQSFRLLYAEDGQAAIRLATAEYPDAVFLVSPLPDGDEEDLAHKLRSLPHPKPPKLFRLFSHLSAAVDAHPSEVFDGSFLLTSDHARLTEWFQQCLDPSPFRIEQEPGTLVVELLDPDFDRYRDRLLEALGSHLRSADVSLLVFNITAWQGLVVSEETGLGTLIARLRVLGYDVILTRDASPSPSTSGS